MDRSYKRLGINTIFVFIGKAGSSLVALLMLPLYTYWLDTDEFGSADLINTYATIILSVISCSIASAVFVIPDRRDNASCVSYYTSGLVFISCVSVLFPIIFFLIKNIYNGENFLLLNGWQVIALTLSMVWQNYTQQFTRALDKMSIFSTAGIIQSLSTAVLALLLIPEYGLGGYIMSLVLSNVVVSLFSFVFSGSYNYVSIRKFDLSKLKELLKYSIPLVPNTIMWWLVNGFNRPMMESQLGLTALGLYAVAMKFPNIITSVSDVFMNAFSISMIEEYGKSTFSNFFNTIFKFVYVIMVVGAIIISIFSKYIITIFASENFEGAWIIMPFLTLSSVFACASSIVGGIFVAKKQSKYYFYSSIYGAVSSVIMTIILMNLLGVIGCAIASGLSFLIMLLVRFYYARNDIKDFPLWWFVFNTSLLVVTILVTVLTTNTVAKTFVYAIIVCTLFYSNRSTAQMLNRIRKKL